MHEDVVEQLLDLNQEFYQTFALHFSETRQRIQPGVLRAIEGIPGDASVLDLGCGNGSFANELASRGHHGLYLGLDSSLGLLSIAEASCVHPKATFHLLDIAKAGWAESLPGNFDRIVAFAVLHHLPGDELRLQILKEIHSVIELEGAFIFSVWNFLESTKLRDRIVPWETVGLNHKQLDGGDYLLDWRRGGYGLRYVHAFEDSELADLAGRSGFSILEHYFSDGEGGKLGWYHVWEPE